MYIIKHTQNQNLNQDDTKMKLALFNFFLFVNNREKYFLPAVDFPSRLSYAAPYVGKHCAKAYVRMLIKVHVWPPSRWCLDLGKEDCGHLCPALPSCFSSGPEREFLWSDLNPSARDTTRPRCSCDEKPYVHLLSLSSFSSQINDILACLVDLGFSQTRL